MCTLLRIAARGAVNAACLLIMTANDGKPSKALRRAQACRRRYYLINVRPEIQLVHCHFIVSLVLILSMFLIVQLCTRIQQ